MLHICMLSSELRTGSYVAKASGNLRRHEWRHSWSAVVVWMRNQVNPMVRPET